MTITFAEERIYTLLTEAADIIAIVSDRVYPDELKQTCLMPAIRYVRISTVPINTLEGFSDVNQSRFQIDCFAETKKGAMDLAKAVLATMDSATTFNALREAWRANYEPETRLYRNILEFAIWNDTE